MSADNRSVHTDALATLGTIIDENAKRDAIHVAVEPVRAGEPISPGDIVLIRDGFSYAAESKETAVGIADPFLERDIDPGQYFWMLVMPRTITSLRHVWSHPAFEDKEPAAEPPLDKAASEAWLREFCSGADCPGYDDVIAAATGKNIYEGEKLEGVMGVRYPDYYGTYNDGEYLHFGGRDAHGVIPDEFWTHVEIVTGKRGLKRAKYFSCSC
jgi:hypothetical protein